MFGIHIEPETPINNPINSFDHLDLDLAEVCCSVNREGLYNRHKNIGIQEMLQLKQYVELQSMSVEDPELTYEVSLFL